MSLDHLAVSNPSRTLQHQVASPSSSPSRESFGFVQFPMDDEQPSEILTELGSLSPPSCGSPQESSLESIEPVDLASSSSLTSTPPFSPIGSTFVALTRAKKPCKTMHASLKKNTPRTIVKFVGTNDKRVGKRKGPLTAEQREGAGQIRKLGACLRCKFLKKPCNAATVCKGCQPSHARLWQLPCTRMSIDELGFFLKDWDVDYRRHVESNYEPANVIYSKSAGSQPLWVSHGYGLAFPVQVREVIFKDNSHSLVHWWETLPNGNMSDNFNVFTANCAPTDEPIDMNALDRYIEAHVTNGRFPEFVEQHFAGTPFVSEMLITAFDYFSQTRHDLLKAVLKLVVAYNLTCNLITLANKGHDFCPKDGQVRWPQSQHCRETVAPTLVKEAVQAALGIMWRELHTEVLKGLQALFSKVYAKDKLKNWPTIFIVSACLLSVWEWMEFDAHMRNSSDPRSNYEFWDQLEGVPVGVITGLFQAISTRLPAYNDWDAKKHQQVLNFDDAACAAMDHITKHISKHDTYLKTRSDPQFVVGDFDCLSNKFLSKLIIRT